MPKLVLNWDDCLIACQYLTEMNHTNSVINWQQPLKIYGSPVEYGSLYGLYHILPQENIIPSRVTAFKLNARACV